MLGTLCPSSPTDLAHSEPPPNFFPGAQAVFNRTDNFPYTKQTNKVKKPLSWALSQEGKCADFAPSMRDMVVHLPGTASACPVLGHLSQ